MSDIARKTLLDVQCDLLRGDQGLALKHIQSAIEEAQQNAYNDGWVAGRDALRLEATRELELTSKVDQEVIDKAVRELEVARADTKRLLGLLRQVYDEHMHFGWGYEDLHDAIYKELEIAKMLPVEAVDAAMKEGK